MVVAACHGKGVFEVAQHRKMSDCRGPLESPASAEAAKFSASALAVSAGARDLAAAMKASVAATLAGSITGRLLALSNMARASSQRPAYCRH